jgi:ATP-dependent DNA ligase
LGGDDPGPLNTDSSRQRTPDGRSWFTPDWFDDGEALFTVVVDQGLEGVVAKRQSSPYRPGERGWIKTKNREYWRYPQELETARRAGERRQRLTI